MEKGIYNMSGDGIKVPDIKSIVLSAGTQENIDAYMKLLRNIADESELSIESVSSAGDVRNILENSDTDLIIINTPLADEQGTELAVYAARNAMRAVLLITSAAIAEKVQDAVNEAGVVMMARPLEKKGFVNAVTQLIAVSTVIKQLHRENEKIRAREEETRLVNRAKAALMEKLNMTEAQAHRYIEKQSMDMRLGKGAIAKNILKTYYNR